MRVRDHLAISAAGAALLYPLFGHQVLAGLAGSVLVDVDHYAWYCIRNRTLDPRDAVRYFNRPDAAQHPATRVLHSPLVITLLLLAGGRRRATTPVAIGMAAHVALDAFHVMRLEQSRVAVLERDAFTCQSCGDRGAHVVAHLHTQPAVLPSYRLGNFISLCPVCHEAAHTQEPTAASHLLRAISVMLAAFRPRKR